MELHQIVPKKTTANGTLISGLNIELSSSDDVDNIVSLVESISRSFSMFGLTKEARCILSEVEQLNPSPFYQSQILRGKLYTCLTEFNNSGKVNMDLIDDLKKKTSQNKYRVFKRHQKQIKSMLKTINKQ